MIRSFADRDVEPFFMAAPPDGLERMSNALPSASCDSYTMRMLGDLAAPPGNAWNC